MRIKILGKFWTLVFKPLRKNDGYCDPPTQRNKEIQVSSQIKDSRRLAVILHECLHAADWHKDEQWVDEVSTDIARVLWRLGYRETSGGVCGSNSGSAGGSVRSGVSVVRVRHRANREESKQS